MHRVQIKSEQDDLGMLEVLEQPKGIRKSRLPITGPDFHHKPPMPLQTQQEIPITLINIRIYRMARHYPS
jgi:hypothetical protein